MFKKNLHLCFFKIKCLPTSSPLTLEDDEDDQEQQHDNNEYNQTIINENHQPPLMIKNFNSIYDLALPSRSTTAATTTATTTFSSISTSSISTTVTSSTNDSDTHPPGFSSTFASQRFFVSSPGRSNSILDSSAAVPTDDGGEKLVAGGVPVDKYSPDPYTDFRRSMQEMIEARERENAGGVMDDDKSEWEFLQELLVCYLTLNPKDTHKCIIEAFADVLVSMMSNHGQIW